MVRKIRIIFGLMFICFCLSVLASCSSQESAEDIIKAYDKGKISDDEFFKRMEALEPSENKKSALDNLDKNIDLSDQYKDYIK